ncbi:MAG: hypothetical protein JSW61_07155 [Candidatus Thorarchaeota archaeon]|nr:MAG: hypothetical protein JSW61_07155 [Candidatus Thorarchaeota archaeon]
MTKTKVRYPNVGMVIKYNDKIMADNPTMMSSARIPLTFPSTDKVSCKRRRRISALWAKKDTALSSQKLSGLT